MRSCSLYLRLLFSYTPREILTSLPHECISINRMKFLIVKNRFILKNGSFIWFNLVNAIFK